MKRLFNSIKNVLSGGIYRDDCCNEKSILHVKLKKFIYRYGLDKDGKNLRYLKKDPDKLIENCYYIDCSNRKLSNIPNDINILPHLTKLICNNNSIKKLPDLPYSIKELDCSNNVIENLPFIPYGMERLDCRKNRLKSLTKLPLTIKVLRCEDNYIRFVSNDIQFFEHLNLYTRDQIYNVIYH